MKKWISLLLVVLVLLSVAPVAMADPEITEDSIITIINVKKYANVHETASKSSNVLGWAPVGNTYKLLAAEGDFYKIQYTSSKVGYVHKTLAKVGKKGDIPSGSKIATLVNEPSSGNGVNIRTSPSSSSSSNIIGVAHNGDKFEVTGKSGKWTKVIYDGKTAYIYTSYLSISGGGSSETITPVDNKKAYILCNTQVNVRAKASSSSTRKGKLKNGAEITVTGTTSKWTRIKWESGEAWVYSQYVTYTKPEDLVGKTATIVNCNTAVNVRSKASSSSTRLGTAAKGSTWTVKGVSGNWVQIQYGSKVGYVYRKYTSIG